MKKIRMTVGILTITLVTLTAMSCKDGKKEEATKPMSSEMHQEDDQNQEGSEMMADNSSNGGSSAIIDDYLKIKNALVDDDNENAKQAGKMLMQSIENFDANKYDSKKAEVNDILADAKEMSEHISESPLKHQREHFKILSKDIEDLVVITGTPTKLYQQYCPMYDDGKGGSWLSTSKAIQNPFYGAKMKKCGKVQNTINP